MQTNPFLTGKLLKSTADEVVCEPAAHVIALNVINGPSDFTLPTTLTEQLKSALKLEALIKPLDQGHEALASGSPLFSVSVVLLPNNFACLCVQLSHILGDGFTYYRVCAQLNAAVNGLPMPPIHWIPAPKSAVIAPHFDATDEYKALKSWEGGFVEKLKTHKPKVNVTVLDSAALQTLKTEYTSHAAGAVEYLSTNDIIVAGLNEVTEAPMSGSMLPSTFSSFLLVLRF